MLLEKVSQPVMHRRPRRRLTHSQRTPQRIEALQSAAECAQYLTHGQDRAMVHRALEPEAVDEHFVVGLVLTGVITC